ncbi:ATP-binding protein [Paraoerskovia marina]|nr:ATP-binding protein [Paraoerskovia marina]
MTLGPTPAGFRELRSWPLLSVDDLAVVRQDLASTLPQSPGASLEEVPESVVLVVSELATNALRHGGGPVSVHLSERSGEVLVDVVDRAPDVAPQFVDGRPVGGGGFGLRLAARLADQLGWYATDTGKHVWAQFSVSSKMPSLSA